MKTNQRLYLFILSFILCISAFSQTYTNPIFEPDLADPTVIKGHDGFYYAYGTENHWGSVVAHRLLPILRSPDMINWTHVGDAFTAETKPNWLEVYNNGQRLTPGLWAPDIVYRNNKYYLYYSLAVWGYDTTGIGVATSDFPEGPFTDLGRVLDSSTHGVANSIDPYIYEEDGKVYLFWGSYRDIYAIELADDMITTVGSKVKIASTQFEGVTITKRGDYYYFIASRDMCCDGPDSKYNLAVARSSTLLGRYEQKEKARECIFSLCWDVTGYIDNSRYIGTDFLMGDGEVYVGPGHNSRIITDEAGNDYLFYHAVKKNDPYLAPYNATKRVLMVDKIVWGDDGWPTIPNTNPSCTPQPMPVVTPQIVMFEVEAGFDPQHGDISVVDINGDDYLDIVVGGIQTDTDDVLKNGIFINQQDNTFERQLGNEFFVPGKFADVRYNDINQDGQIDMIYNGWGGKTSSGGTHIGSQIGIALGDNGQFVKSRNYITTSGTISCGMYDLDNNGLVDYFHFGKEADGLTIFYQEHDGTFTRIDNSFGDGLSIIDIDVEVVDYDNDGKLDFSINGWLGEGRYATIYKNNGERNFSKIDMGAAFKQKGFGSMTWADIDGCGRLELLINGDGDASDLTSDTYRIYKFTRQQFLLRAEFKTFRQISVGDGGRFIDWNNDGKLDVLVTGWDATRNRQSTSIFECKDISTFTYVENKYSDLFAGVSESSVEVADLNNDNLADILVTGYNGKYNRNICGYYLNPSETVNAAPSTPANLDVSIKYNVDNTADIDFRWEASTDDKTPANALSYNFGLYNATNNKWYYNPMADLSTGKRKTTGMGNVFLNKSWSLSNMPQGEYIWYVQAVDAHSVGGGFASQSIEVSKGTSLIRNPKIENVAVYVENQTIRVVSTDSKDISVCILATDGRLVKTINNQNSISATLTKGVYILKIQKDNIEYTQKVSIYKSK